MFFDFFYLYKDKNENINQIHLIGKYRFLFISKMDQNEGMRAFLLLNENDYASIF